MAGWFMKKRGRGRSIELCHYSVFGVDVESLCFDFALVSGQKADDWICVLFLFVFGYERALDSEWFGLGEMESFTCIIELDTSMLSKWYWLVVFHDC